MAAAAAAANPIFAASCCYCYHQQTRRATKLPTQFPTTKSLISQLGILPSPWNGLKLLPISSPSFYGLKEKKRKFRGKVVHASLFGVGAPEALVIGVVALLVFGPKGLAEVARNLGKTLRAFQPTIRELQDVSREFKSTLEREIGLDEVTSSTNNTDKPTAHSNETQQATVDPNGTPKLGAYTSDNLMKNALEQLAASATESQTQASIPQEQQQEQPVASAIGSQTQGSIPQEEQESQTQASIRQEQQEEQPAASAIGSQTQGSIPQEQQGEVLDTPSKVTISTSPEAAAQIQSSEKEDKEK